jgi:hypothetical protein
MNQLDLSYYSKKDLPNILVWAFAKLLFLSKGVGSPAGHLSG